MKRLSSFPLVVVVTACFLAHANAQSSDVSGVAAQDHWNAVQSIRHRSLIVVQQAPSVQGGNSTFQRCILKEVSGTDLTCKALGFRGKEVVLSASSVEAIYRVKAKTADIVLAIFGVAAAATFVTGAATNNTDAEVIGVVALLIAGLVALFHAAGGLFDHVSGATSGPLPPNESRVLIYQHLSLPPVQP